MMAALVWHLVESTVFAALVAVFPFWMRKQSAAARHGLWLIAAAKFAVPAVIFSFAGLELHGLFPVHSGAPLFRGGWPELIPSRPITAAVSPLTPRGWGVILFLTFWLCGLAAMLAVRLWRMRPSADVYSPPDPSEREQLQRLAGRMGIRKTIGWRLSKAKIEPGVSGFWRPTITVPEGLSSSLDPGEWEAVLLHELAHVKRRDNGSAAFAQLLTCIFWFHPLLWWIERRLIAEQERACDEMALAYGAAPAVYVSGLCKVCRFHLAQAGGNVCGIAGSSLKDRMEAIMNFQSLPRRLESAPRILMGALASIMFVVPFLFGLFVSPLVLAQRTRIPASALRASLQGAPACVFESKSYPQGTVVQTALQGVSGSVPPNMCATDLHGRPKWVPANASMRARRRKIVIVPLIPLMCNPMSSPFAKYCACKGSAGALEYSPGSRVFSPQGPLKGWLVCRQNKWRVSKIWDWKVPPPPPGH